MSIIEKAVKGARPGRAQQKRAEKKPSPVLPAAQAGEAVPPDVVDIRRVTDKGMITFEEHPQLAKDFRFLKRPILARVFGLSSKNVESGKVVMVMSHSPQVGKSFVAYNLAVSMAYEQMTHVLLIDADPFRRTLTQALGLDDRVGLQEVLSDLSLGFQDAILKTTLPSLKIIPSGQLRSDSTELFASRRMSDLLDSLHDPELVVIIDAPPLAETSEGRALIEKADHSLVVIGAGSTTESQIKNMLRIFEMSGSSVSFVLNRAMDDNDISDSAYYPYYDQVVQPGTEGTPPVADES